MKELKAELAMRDMLNGRSAVNYGDLSEAEAVELQALVKRFLQGGEQASLVAACVCGCVKSVWLVRRFLKGAEQASHAAGPGQGLAKLEGLAGRERGLHAPAEKPA